MLPRKNRLDLRVEDFFNQRLKKINGVFFQALYKKSKKTRFAVIMPKKCQNKSTARNYLKRVVRNEISLFLARNKQIKQTEEVVFICKKTPSKTSFSEIGKDINKILTKTFNY